MSGSDLAASRATRRLAGMGATIFRGHDASQVEGVDVLVVSSAVSEENPEVMAARERRIPVVPRAEMLAELMRFRRGIVDLSTGCGVERWGGTMLRVTSARWSPISTAICCAAAYFVIPQR